MERHALFALNNGLSDKFCRLSVEDLIEGLKDHQNRVVPGVRKDRNKLQKIAKSKEMPGLNDMKSLTGFHDSPDLWLAAFDNPSDFISYCRKRIAFQEKMIRDSKDIEEQVVKSLETWCQNVDKSTNSVLEMHKLSELNDKLVQAVMEERTSYGKLVGQNDELERLLLLLARKYEAALVLGKVKDKSVQHLLERNPRALENTDRLRELNEELRKVGCSSKPEITAGATDADRKTIFSLQSQIERMKKDHLEETTVLKSTITNKEVENKSLEAKYFAILTKTRKEMEEAQGMIGSIFRQNIELRKELLAKEDKFLQYHLEEIKENMKRPLQFSSKDLKEHNREVFAHHDSAVAKDLKLKLTKNEIELTEKSELLRDASNENLILKRRCMLLEEKLVETRNYSKSSMAKMRDCMRVLEQRESKIDSRRKMDNAGFRKDVEEVKRLLTTGKKTLERYMKNVPYPEQACSCLDDMPKDHDLDLKLRNSGILLKQAEKSDVSPTNDITLETVHPRVVHKAYSIWGDHVGSKIDKLDSNLRARSNPASSIQKNTKKSASLKLGKGARLENYKSTNVSTPSPKSVIVMKHRNKQKRSSVPIHRRLADLENEEYDDIDDATGLNYYHAI